MFRSRADWAAAYVRRWGFALVPVLPASKVPRYRRWNTASRYLKRAARARRHWQRYPQDNLGVLLGASGLVSLDIDEPAWAEVALAAAGVRLESGKAPVLAGRLPRIKYFFRAPAGVSLERRALRWPGGDSGRLTTVLELRAGKVQDLLPPSIHPDTQKPYRWLVTPWQLREIPELPDEVLALWLAWDEAQPELLAACPWAEQEKAERKSLNPAPESDAWDDLRDHLKQHLPLEPFLEELGAKRRGSSYLCPFHQERHPSFWTFESASGYPLWVDAHGGAPVGRTAGQGYSFGDVIDLYQALHGLPSPGKATAELAREIGLIPS